MTKKNPKIATSNPFETETERKGRGRKQQNSNFVKSENSERRLTAEELIRAKDFYQANAAQTIQFRRMAREWGCGNI